MPKRVSNPPANRAKHDDGVWELLQSTLKLLAFLCIGCGYLLVMALIVAHQNRPRWNLYAAPALLLAGGVATVILRWPYRPKASLLVSLVFASAVVANRAVGTSPMQTLYLLTSVLAGVLLGPPWAALFAGLGTAAIVSHVGGMPGDAATSLNLGILWLTAALMWAAVGKLHLAVERAEGGQLRAWESMRAARLRRGELYGALRALEEATYRIERMNNELYMAKRDAEEARSLKGRFVATVSHEIRGPLNLILGFSRMMALFPERYGGPAPESYRTDIQTIYRSSQHLHALVDDILDLSQIDAQSLPLVKDQVHFEEDVIDKVVRIVGPLAERKGLYLHKDLPSDLPWVLADPVRLRQGLLNLLTNAVRVTEQGGITVRAQVESDRLLVAVQDTGPGISAEQMPQLFKEFQKLRDGQSDEAGGSGLGLSICKHLVELHGGRIWAESQRGVGTTFYFTIPLSDGQLPEPALIRTDEARHRSTLPKSYLVACEDPVIVRLLGRYIEDYRAIGLSDVHEVLRLTEELHPRAIIATPDLAESIRVQLAGTPFHVPIITFGASNGVGPRAFLAPLGYLVKPISAEAVAAFMRKVERDEETVVLVVDDDPDTVRLVELMLTALPRPYTILKAYDGGQALEIMRQTQPDVVFLDLLMPDLDGNQTLALMRSDDGLREVPVVILSAQDCGEGSVTLGTSISLYCQDPVEVARGAKCLQAMLDSVSPRYLSEPEPPALSEPAPPPRSVSPAHPSPPVPEPDPVG